MSELDVQRTLGAHEAQLAELRQWRWDLEARIDKRLESMDGKLDAMHDAIVTAHGWWRALMMMGSLATAIAGGMLWVYHVIIRR